MFGIFKNKKTAFTQYFPDQKPGERIHSVISEYIRPNLEQNGFKMLKSELSFKRKTEQFEQEILFSKSRHNRANEMVRFDIGFIVRSNFYSNWHKKTYGEKPLNNIILALVSGYLPNWDKKYLHLITWYDLAKDDNSKIVEIINKNIKDIGLPFIDNISDFTLAVDYIMRMERYAASPMLMDFCEINNNKSKAIEVLNWFEQIKQTTDIEFSNETLKAVELRKERIKTGYNNMFN